jgi:hypothetical protein
LEFARLTIIFTNLQFQDTPSVVSFMANSTYDFGNTNPFSDENAEQHQWKPEPSEDDPGFSSEHSGTSAENLDSSLESSGTSGEYTDHPDPESLLNPYGDEEVSWESQGATNDDSIDNHYTSDSHGGDHSSGFSLDAEDTQDEQVDRDAGTEGFPENMGQTFGDSGQADNATDYTTFDSYFRIPDDAQAYQPVDNDPNPWQEEPMRHGKNPVCQLL